MNYQITTGDPNSLRDNLILVNPRAKVEINRLQTDIVKIQFSTDDAGIHVYSDNIDQISIYENLTDEEVIILDSYPFYTWEGRDYYTRPTLQAIKIAREHQAKRNLKREARKSKAVR